MLDAIYRLLATVARRPRRPVREPSRGRAAVPHPGAAAWLALALLAAAMPPARGAPDAPPPPETTLVWLNRDIVTMRATLAGAPPAVRAERARDRIDEIPDDAMDAPLRALPFTLDGVQGQQIVLGDRLLFSLLDGDLDPEQRAQGLAPLVAETLRRLQDARAAWHAARDRQQLWHGALLAALATAGFVLLAWLVASGTRRGMVLLERERRSLAAAGQPVDWREVAARLIARSARLLEAALLLALAYAWVRLVLGAFAFTRPWSEQLGAWLVDQLRWVLHGIAASVPGIVTVVIVLVLTRAFVDALGYCFDAVQRGRVQLPLLHPETTPATRRIVIALVWVIGIAVAYPYLPGAGSEAFKGLSVLVGLMLTMGATGIVTQAMSGLLVIYARALRKGDYVQVGGVEGVVTEVAPLATKVMNLRNEEITIPNAVLIAQPIHNFSKLATTHGTLLSTRVTIGYDAPWRQVHALLEAAARATDGVRTDPAPRVFQRALSDFYVEYELLFSIDRPIERVPVLSRLHAQIQDEFNRAGVQIMSPHFYEQPPQPLVVPPALWQGGKAAP